MTSNLNDYKRFRNHRFLSTTKIDLNQILYNIKKLNFIGKILSQRINLNEEFVCEIKRFYL